MTALKTPEDWWAEYTDIQEDIKGYAEEMPCFQIVDHPAALRIFGAQVIGLMQEYADLKKTTWQMMDDLLAKKDRRLHWILNSIWVDAPDKPYIHSWPSWGRFCDLCSEGGWILFPEMEFQPDELPAAPIGET